MGEVRAWWPDRGETEEDGEYRSSRVPQKHRDTVREFAEYIAEKDWSESGDYWRDAVLRVRWTNGIVYEFSIEVESVPHFNYAAKELTIEAPRGVAGDSCGYGNECGRIGCPECQQ